MPITLRFFHHNPIKPSLAPPLLPPIQALLIERLPDTLGPAYMSVLSLSPNRKLRTTAGPHISFDDLFRGPNKNDRAPSAEVGAFPGVVEELVELINGKNRAILTLHARKCVLDALCALCATKNGAQRCVAAEGVVVTVDILTVDWSREPACTEECEKSLHLLHLLTSSCDEGRATALEHSAAIIPALGKNLLRVSEAATDFAIAILCTLCRHSDTALFRRALSGTSIRSKLVVVLQVYSKDSTKRRAGRLLRLIEQSADPQ